MRLIVDPTPALALFQQDLGLIICVRDGLAPEIHVKGGLPKPDRHLLLGLMQTVAVAVGEMDRELVDFVETRSIVLDSDAGSMALLPGLVIARSTNGEFGVLAPQDTRQARVLARQALRWFTGTIRLDVP